MSLPEFVIRVCCAVTLGFLIGLERQLTGHSAGIRTNILVSMGACLFTLFSQLMDAPDTTRVAAQIVTGIGFLCGGVIFKEGMNIRGLTTAATIWCTAAIGVLCSSSRSVFFAVAATAILLASNLIFRFISDRVQAIAHFEEEENTYVISVSCWEENEFRIRSTIVSRLNNTRLHLIHLQSADEIGGKVEIEATVQLVGRRKDEYIEKLTAHIALEKGVTKVGWELA